MCFETTESAKLKIAKKDIKCWKVLDGNLAPFFSTDHGYNSPYIENKRNIKVKIEKVLRRTSIGKRFVVNEGYHSFRSLLSANMFAQGWSSWSSEIRIFIIPKGTRYFSNRTEYVSETIILVE
jgi:hypothetical protein